MKRNCQSCGKEFTTYPVWIKRGGGKFCSPKCGGVPRDRKIEKVCEYCGTRFKRKPSLIKNNASRFCSPKCGQLASRGVEKPSIQGDKPPNWRGGLSVELYPLGFNDELKELIRKRDDYKCQICGLIEEEHIFIYGQTLPIHHIDYVKENHKEDNLIALCHQCHGRTNYNREYWQNHFLKKTEAI